MNMKTGNRNKTRRGGLAVLLLCLCCAGLPSCFFSKKAVVKKDEKKLIRPKIKKVVPDTSAQPIRNVLAEIPAVDTTGGLSNEDILVVKACNNYLQMLPNSPKNADVLQIKASTYYNAKKFPQARETYKEILSRYPKSHYQLEATKMIAQSHYEQKEFNEAETWYRKLRQLASASGEGESEALTRISEAIYHTAERLEKEEKYNRAAKEYERIATEFPAAKIADVSLLNSGLIYEKMSDWSSAILNYNKLINLYASSNHVPRAYFRSAKSQEKLGKWEDAAKTYLTLVKKYPKNPMSPDAIYNAGFCFENAENLAAAAKTFEKTAELYPKSKDAANVLFRAGELYIRLKDWANVARINKIFERKFGDDKERIVQSLCMAGIAAKMQENPRQAIASFKKAVSTYSRLKAKSEINIYYAAKAQFELGQIYKEMMMKVELVQPQNVYRARLREKTKLLEMCVQEYTKTISFNISEWTTQAIYNIGHSLETFGLSIFKQQRPKNVSIVQLFALETGISKAVVEYLIIQALPYYERNVRLGIKLKHEDKWILKSREKLTRLPYYAGNNYTRLMKLMRKNATPGKKGKSMAMIGAKLQALQQFAPLQDEAINLYLKCIEMGVKYRVTDEYVTKAKSELTVISYNVGETYRDIVDIAKSAPIPPDLTDYETFLYKIKLVQNIVVDYENRALEAYLKNVSIANAYKLKDEWVDSCKVRIGQALFDRARSYDLLAIQGLDNPPLSDDLTEEEKDIYRSQFEELAFKLQDQAIAIYNDILIKARANDILGQSAYHAYIRLYQLNPKDYGKKFHEEEERVIGPGPQWLYSLGVPDPSHPSGMKWERVRKAVLAQSAEVKGFSDRAPPPMWGGTGDEEVTAGDGAKFPYKPAQKVMFRRKFITSSIPTEAFLEIAAADKFVLEINDKKIEQDSAQLSMPWHMAKRFEARTYLKKGKNIIMVKVKNESGSSYGMLFVLKYKEMVDNYKAVPPGMEEPLTQDEIKNHIFPSIPNFGQNISSEKENTNEEVKTEETKEEGT